MMLIFCGVDIVYLWSGDMNLAKKTAPILLPLALGSFLKLFAMDAISTTACLWVDKVWHQSKCNSRCVINTCNIFGYPPLRCCWCSLGLGITLNTGYLIVGMHFMYKKLLPSEKWAWYWQDITKQTMFAVFVMVVVRIYDGMVVNQQQLN